MNKPINTAEVWLWGSRIGYLYQPEGSRLVQFEYDREFLRACLVSRCVQIFEQIFQLTRRKAAGMLTHFKVFRRSSGEKSAEKMCAARY